jgi:potassium efflux system protein
VNPDGQDLLGALDAVLGYSFSIGGQTVSLADLFIVVAILALSWALSRLLRRTLAQIMRRRGVDDDGTVAVTSRILHYLIIGLALLTALSQIGINLSALFAAGAVFAVGIGFALQNLSENFVSGVILLFERSIKPGDVLEVEGMTVRVLQMGIRTTLCRNQDDEEIIVPNSTLVRNTVRNQTLRDTLQRLRAGVGIAYESDLRKAMSVLHEAADSLSWRSRKRAPVVLLTEFGDSSVVLEVSVWIEDPWQAPLRRSQLMEAIWHTLHEHDITIAFPQLDVHLDGPDAAARPARRPPDASGDSPRDAAPEGRTSAPPVD